MQRIRMLGGPDQLKDLVQNYGGYRAILFSKKSCRMCHFFLPTFIDASDKLFDKYDFYLYKLDPPDNSPMNLSDSFDQVADILKQPLDGTPTLLLAYGSPTRLVSVPYYSVMTAHGIDPEGGRFIPDTLIEYMTTFPKYF